MAVKTIIDSNKRNSNQLRAMDPAEIYDDKNRKFFQDWQNLLNTGLPEIDQIENIVTNVIPKIRHIDREKFKIAMDAINQELAEMASLRVSSSEHMQNTIDNMDAILEREMSEFKNLDPNLQSLVSTLNEVLKQTVNFHKLVSFEKDELKKILDKTGNAKELYDALLTVNERKQKAYDELISSMEGKLQPVLEKVAPEIDRLELEVRTAEDMAKELFEEEEALIRYMLKKARTPLAYPVRTEKGVALLPVAENIVDLKRTAMGTMGKPRMPPEQLSYFLTTSQGQQHCPLANWVQTEYSNELLVSEIQRISEKYVAELRLGIERQLLKVREELVGAIDRAYPYGKALLP